jgi:hypothetical protein
MLVGVVFLQIENEHDSHAASSGCVFANWKRPCPDPALPRGIGRVGLDVKTNLSTAMLSERT